MRKKPRVWLKRVLLGMAALLAIFVLVVVLWFGDSLRTLTSLRQPDREVPFYTLEYKLDYGLEDLLRQGIATDRELLDYLVKRLLRGKPFDLQKPAFACSTFVAATPQGQRLFGRNFDLTDSPAMLLVTRPPQGYASLSLVNLSFLGFDDERGLPGGLIGRIPLLAAPFVPVDGVNEQGLAVAVLMLDEPPTRQDSGQTKITTTVAMRMLLDQAATVDEAVALLSRYDMQTPGEGSYHLHIVDAKGGAVVVEYIDQQMVVVPSDKATNFLLAPQAPVSGGEGRDRFALLDARLRDSGSSLDASQAMQLLSDVCSTPDMWPDGITQTQWSAVYNLSQPSVDIAIAMDYGKVFRFSLGTD